jgi:deazaflavin-dependent oxidoreductase (nitroreductase family)
MVSRTRLTSSSALSGEKETRPVRACIAAPLGRGFAGVTLRREYSGSNGAYDPQIDSLDLADRLWFLLAPMMRGHAALYRATGGRIGGRLPGLPSLLLLDHVGAKSGKRRTTPLVYMPEGERFLVVASKGGHPRHPAWFHNLRAHPDTEVQIGTRRIQVHAREADEQERDLLWPKAADYNPHWGRYRKRAPREIPLVLLEPR